MNKTHYRQVYKSDHLGQADLEDYIESQIPLVFTIKQAKQERGVMVAGRKGDHNVVYFEPLNGKKVKPWVVNATYGAIIKGFAKSSFLEDWAGITLELYIDPSVRMKGETVGGVRVSPRQPQPKAELLQNSPQWNNAVEAFKRDGNLKAVLKHVSISPQNQQLIAQQANA